MKLGQDRNVHNGWMGKFFLLFHGHGGSVDFGV
ncbi:hypothetical protein SAMN04488688_102364 [Paenibacillus sp. cl141a]|nr:hypothetical protein SAMN04488688_102364 [Paenibacillus sp. cl141a]